MLLHLMIVYQTVSSIILYMNAILCHITFTLMTGFQAIPTSVLDLFHLSIERLNLVVLKEPIGAG